MHTEEPADAHRAGHTPPGEAPRSVPIGTTSIPSGAGAPRAARAAIRQWMTASVPVVVLQDALLLISELVSNSVQHAGATDGAPITVTSGALDGVVWFDVADGGGRGGVARRPAEASGGMGLNIVDAIATRWGSSHGDGTHVWFELPVRPPHAPSPRH